MVLYDALRNLKKKKKKTRRSVTFKPGNLLKVTLLHGYFSRFLIRTNGTKMRNASHILKINRRK